MNSIVERLRGFKSAAAQVWAHEAADLIEQQAERIKELEQQRDELKKILAGAEADKEQQRRRYDEVAVLAGALRAELTTTEQQRDEYKKDAERLNWLELNPRHAQVVADRKVTDCIFYGISCAELVRLRDAIDAAMKEQK